MDTPTHVEHLRVEAAALLAAYRADPAAAVPTCPGWDRAALLGHVAGVHAWVRAQLAVGTGERVRLSSVEAPPSGAALAEWYEAGAAALVAGLSSMDVSVPWPTWAGPQPGTFYPRRMAQETAMHRRDADPCPLDPALAVDGIDELMELFLPRVPAERLDGPAATIHLHATDVMGEWLVQIGPHGLTFERGHAKGDVALRGSAGDLLLWAWNRAGVDERFEVFGEAALLDRWRQAVVF